jgi:hypothetical protein
VSLGTLIDRLAEEETNYAITDTVSSLQTVVQRSLPKHPMVKVYVSEMYGKRIPAWADNYQLIAEKYDLRLRAQYSWYDVAQLLNAIVEGTSLRGAIDASLARLSNGHSILAVCIRLMLPSLLTDPIRLDETYPRG